MNKFSYIFMDETEAVTEAALEVLRTRQATRTRNSVRKRETLENTLYGPVDQNKGV